LKKYFNILFPTIILVSIVAMPELGFCSVESTLSAIQTKLISTVLPLAAIIGLVIAALSFVSGSPNARNHLLLAICGAIVGFGAPSIIAFIRGVVQ